MPNKKWSPLKVLMLPVYALQIITGEKRFIENPLLGSEKLNRKGLHIWRVRTAAKIVELRRRRLQHLIPQNERTFFAENGYIERRNFLAPEMFAQLRSEVEALRAPAREMTQGKAVTRRTSLTPEVLKNYPAIRALVDSNAWSDPLRYVGGFKAEPVISIQTIFGTETEEGKGKDPQTDLHMDTFHSTVKAWFFLYDVPKDEGPFTYVAGSHKLTKRRLAWHKRKSILASMRGDNGSFRIPENQLHLLRLPEPTKFAVPANTLVVGDTFGFHARGKSVRPSVRVEIYASQRPNPFLPFVGLDAAFLPFVKGRKEVIGWFIEDCLVRLGLRRQIWKDIGTAGPLDSR
ncbi:phytanoyl-CoA dioxygenase family protein [Rhizobium mongolense]|uniref:phytanoyl-CoA dioxygenase family protein n=1 Tax=Rhizobium mongolense TaxID=57676 RepID=UPI0035582D9F